MKRIELFMADPHSPILRNHKLSGKLIGFYSIDVNGDWRALCITDQANDMVIFCLLGTHGELCK